MTEEELVAVEQFTYDSLVDKFSANIEEGYGSFRRGEKLRGMIEVTKELENSYVVSFYINGAYSVEVQITTEGHNFKVGYEKLLFKYDGSIELNDTFEKSIILKAHVDQQNADEQENERAREQVKIKRIELAKEKTNFLAQANDIFD